MATLEKRTNKQNEVTYRVRIRRKGLPTISMKVPITFHMRRISILLAMRLNDTSSTSCLKSQETRTAVRLVATATWPRQIVSALPCSNC